MAALAARPYTRRVTNPDQDARPAELLDRARTMLDAAAQLIEAAEHRLAGPPPGRAEAEADARAAVGVHELARTTSGAAQGVMYTAVRRLKDTGASRPEIRQATGLTASLIKWIVEHHAEARRARRRRSGGPTG